MTFAEAGREPTVKADHSEVDDGDKPGTLYITLSILLARERLETCFKQEEWSDALKRRFPMGHAGKLPMGDLAKAIDPFFADIADRERLIFSEEALIDASQREHKIVFSVPATIVWNTEGKKMLARLGDVPMKLKALCRPFWYLHSNGSLSYNLSLELDYFHRIRDYYALSVLQKAMFCSEGTEEMFQNQGKSEDPMEIFLCSSSVKACGQVFWGKIQELFETDATNLLCDRMALTPPRGQWWELVQNKADDACRSRPWWHLWNWGMPKLVQNEGVDTLIKPDFSRAAFLLRDSRFFKVLNKPEKERNPDKLPDPELDMTCLPVEDKDNPVLNYGPDVLNSVDGWNADRLDLYFLSGFLRNIIDFLRQNPSEVKDGTDRKYPSGENNEPDFLLYINQHSVFEVVSESRSLEKGGREYIGTCPYLFLVHIMAFHNEALIRLYEREVKKLVLQVEDMVVLNKNEPLKPKVLEKLVSAFHKNRLDIFKKVEKYTHLNVFRYDTEEAFYEAIESTRGIQKRQQHWEHVMSKLSKTIDGFHAMAQKRTETLLKYIGLAITILGLNQVLNGTTQSMRNMNKWLGTDLFPVQTIGNYYDVVFIAFLMLALIWLVPLLVKKLILLALLLLKKVGSWWSKTSMD